MNICKTAREVCPIRTYQRVLFSGAEIIVTVLTHICPCFLLPPRIYARVLSSIAVFLVSAMRALSCALSHAGVKTFENKLRHNKTEIKTDPSITALNVANSIC